eukprot:scaffold189716_cov28-Tisochrysis_lutea.AAC.1
MLVWVGGGRAHICTNLVSSSLWTGRSIDLPRGAPRVPSRVPRARSARSARCFYEVERVESIVSMKDLGCRFVGMFQRVCAGGPQGVKLI